MDNALVMEIEKREKHCAPIVSSEVCNNLYYSVALIDQSETFIYWYVCDVLGFDLNKGYDPYKSETGRTWIPWSLPEHENHGTIVIINQDSLKLPVVGRYECISPLSIVCSKHIYYDEDKDNAPFAPEWFGKFMSYSCSSIC